MIEEYHIDDDSGLDIDTEALEMEEHVDSDKLSINLRVISIPISSLFQIPIEKLTFFVFSSAQNQIMNLLSSISQ